jgi:hypothetical protein
MSFSTRRGRPAKPKEVLDKGTPELQAKHAAGITSEAIDLCLDRSLITVEEHWAGLHYRWLYTIRYGAPSVSSHWWRLAGENRSASISNNSSEWRSLREQEYSAARALLLQKRSYDTVMRLAVYNDVPSFLRPELLQRALAQPALLSRIEHEREQLTSGLKELVEHWQHLIPRLQK